MTPPETTPSPFLQMSEGMQDVTQAETPTPRADAMAAKVRAKHSGDAGYCDLEDVQALERELQLQEGLVEEMRKFESIRNGDLVIELAVANARIAELEQSLDKIANEHRERGLGAPLGGRIAELEQQLQDALDGHKLAFDAVTEAGAREAVLRAALVTIHNDTVQGSKLKEIAATALAR